MHDVVLVWNSRGQVQVDRRQSEASLLVGFDGSRQHIAIAARAASWQAALAGPRWVKHFGPLHPEEASRYRICALPTSHLHLLLSIMPPLAAHIFASMQLLMTPCHL